MESNSCPLSMYCNVSSKRDLYINYAFLGIVTVHETPWIFTVFLRQVPFWSKYYRGLQLSCLILYTFIGWLLFIDSQLSTVLYYIELNYIVSMRITWFQDRILIISLVELNRYCFVFVRDSIDLDKVIEEEGKRGMSETIVRCTKIVTLKLLDFSEGLEKSYMQ